MNGEIGITRNKIVEKKVFSKMADTFLSYKNPRVVGVS